MLSRALVVHSAQAANLHLERRRQQVLVQLLEVVRDERDAVLHRARREHVRERHCHARLCGAAHAPQYAREAARDIARTVLEAVVLADVVVVRDVDPGRDPRRPKRLPRVMLQRCTARGRGDGWRTAPVASSASSAWDRPPAAWYAQVRLFERVLKEYY